MLDADRFKLERRRELGRARGRKFAAEKTAMMGQFVFRNLFIGPSAP